MNNSRSLERKNADQEQPEKQKSQTTASVLAIRGGRFVLKVAKVLKEFGARARIEKS